MEEWKKDLLAKWKSHEEERARLWKEILAAGLYLEASGLDPKKRDTSWHGRVSTFDEERAFYKGVKGGKRVQKEKEEKWADVNLEEWS